ncbi:MAG: hypothetical protein ACQKBU_01150 [Verrucomicrobiales bacterium]
MDGEVLLYEGGCVSDRRHNALIFAPLQEAMEALGKRRIDEVLLGSGPGSYSGTRVGIAAGQGVAMVHACPAVAIPSLLGVEIGEGVVIGDARRGTFWMAECGQGRVPVPELLSAADLVTKIRGKSRIFSFESPKRFALPEGVEVEEVVPSAGALVKAWRALPPAEREALSAVAPQPVYLKPPHITESKKGHPLLRGKN